MKYILQIVLELLLLIMPYGVTLFPVSTFLFFVTDFFCWFFFDARSQIPILIHWLQEVFQIIYN